MMKKTFYGRKAIWVSSPQTLLDTMVFYVGFFALRSDIEHRNLMMDILEYHDNVIIYTEAYSKNKQGGLAQRHAP